MKSRPRNTVKKFPEVRKGTHKLRLLSKVISSRIGQNTLYVISETFSGMVTFYFTEIEGEVVSRSWTLTVPPRVLGTGHRPGGQDLGLFSRIFRMTVTHQDQKNFLSIKIRIVVTFDVFNCIRVGVYDESHKKTNIFVRSTSFRYGSNTDLDQRYLSHSISQ